MFTNLEYVYYCGKAYCEVKNLKVLMVTVVLLIVLVVVVIVCFYVKKSHVHWICY